MRSTDENRGDKTLELDNANFVVSPEKYKAFLAALDEPPKSVPALRKLLSDETAKNFYQKPGFEPAPHNEFHLFMKISDIRASLSDED